MTVVGVDACKHGWIAVELGADRAPVAHFVATIAELPALVPEAGVVGIDIPIGLATSGKRWADVEARAVIGARSSSVFPTPPRAMLEAETYEAANALAVEREVAQISKQSWGLRHRIFEVEAWLAQRDGAEACPVVEVHPEVSFATLNGEPLGASKKTWAGMVERVRLLEGVGISLAEVTGPATREAAIDDMLDAGIVAWTAMRVLRDEAISIPSPPQEVQPGVFAAIWA